MPGIPLIVQRTARRHAAGRVRPIFPANALSTGSDLDAASAQVGDGVDQRSKPRPGVLKPAEILTISRCLTGVCDAGVAGLNTASGTTLGYCQGDILTSSTAGRGERLPMSCRCRGPGAARSIAPMPERSAALTTNNLDIPTSAPTRARRVAASSQRVRSVGARRQAPASDSSRAGDRSNRRR